MQFDRGYQLRPYPYARQWQYCSYGDLISGRPTEYKDCYDIGGFTEVAVKVYTRIAIHINLYMLYFIESGRCYWHTILCI